MRVSELSRLTDPLPAALRPCFFRHENFLQRVQRGEVASVEPMVMVVAVDLPVIVSRITVLMLGLLSLLRYNE